MTKAATSHFQDVGSTANAWSEPSVLLEWGYYLIVFYSTLSGAFGLAVERIGIFILALLCLLCFLTVGSRVLTLAALPIGCGISHILVQLIVHEESFDLGYVRNFVPWMLGLIIIQTLAMRKNFLKRFALFTLCVGLALLPFISFYDAGGFGRASLDRSVGYANPNALGGWFGFCAVYFVIRGLIAEENISRIWCWITAVGCFYVVGLTVSRGALLAAAVATVIASRHLLKKGFVPVLLLTCLCATVIQVGLFDETQRSFNARMSEGSARFQVWPLLIEKFLDAFLFGVGVSNAGVIVSSGKWTNAHNGFIFLAAGSGIIPLAFFIAYWIRSTMAALRAKVRDSPDALFYIPLLVYAFLIICSGNLDFQTPWVMVTLAVPLAASTRGKQFVPHPNASWPSQLHASGVP
jgi:hypothetical protein